MRSSTLARLLVALVAAVVLGGEAWGQSATYNWNTTDITTGWTSSSTNWTPNGTPGATGTSPNELKARDIAVFNNAATIANISTSSIQLTVGTIRLTGSTDLVIGNSHATVDKILELRGAYAASGLDPTLILDATGANLTIQNATGGGSRTMGVRLGTNNALINASANRTVTITSVVSDGGGNRGITFQGGGTLVLSAANTYANTTTINAGTLIASNTTGSATGAGSVTVASGGLLGGTGTVSGFINVNTGGAVRGDVGAGTGTLKTTSVAVNAGGRLSVFLGSGTTASKLDLVTAASGSDLTFADNSILRLSSSGAISAGTRTLATVSNGTNDLIFNSLIPGAENANILGRYVRNGSGSGVLTGAVQIDVGDLTGVTLNEGDTFTLSRSGNSLVLTFTPVPEPATVLAIGAAGLGLASWVRRRRKATATA